MSTEIIGYVLAIPGNDYICPTFDFGEVTSYRAISSATDTKYGVNACGYTNYNLTNISEEDITKWSNNFIFGYAQDPVNGTHTLNTIILPNFCDGDATNCPPDPMSNSRTGMPTCSRFLDTTSYTCSLWAADNEIIADNIKRDWCERNSSVTDGVYTGPVECDCINKNLNPVYIALNPNDPSADHCWYVPCSNPSFYLTYSTEVYSECPALCGIIVQNYNDEAEIIGLEEANKYVNCNLNDDETSIQKITRNINSLLLFTSSSSSNDINSYGWWYFLFALLLLFVIGVSIGFGIYMQRR